MIILSELPVAAAQNNDQVISLFKLLVKGGIVMIPIFILSLVAFYVFIEKILLITGSSKSEANLAEKIIMYLSKNQKENAIQLCKQNRSLGKIFENGITMVGKPVNEIEAVIESSANIEISKMERHTGYLGIIAGIAPMLGFIGTISGVIKIFYNISLTENISIGVIADGLYQKMVTSGAGLIVGVVAYTFYHFLQMRIDRFTEKVQEEELIFIKSLQK